MPRMTKADWVVLDHFGMEEKDQQGRFAFPLPYAMDVELMFRLDEMRRVIGRMFVVHESTGGEHTSEFHGLGKAVDGHFVGLSAIEQYLHAEHFNWPGLGFYPHWHDPGIHVDTRGLGPYQKAARWWRNNQGVYNSITPGIILQT